MLKISFVSNLLNQLMLYIYSCTVTNFSSLLHCLLHCNVHQILFLDVLQVCKILKVSTLSIKAHRISVVKTKRLYYLARITLLF